MKIAIDLDGVVMRSMEAWLEQFHPYFTIEEFVHWDIFKHPKLNVTEEQFYKELEEQDYSKIKPMNGAIQGIKTLKAYGHDVFFLTAKKIELFEKTIDWLEKHELGNIRVAFDSDKLKYDFDYLLDDNPAYSKDPRVIILSRGWNKDCSNVVDSWVEFVKLVKMERIKININDCGICLHVGNSTECLDENKYPTLGLNYPVGLYEAFLDRSTNPPAVKFLRIVNDEKQ